MKIVVGTISEMGKTAIRPSISSKMLRMQSICVMPVWMLSQSWMEMPSGRMDPISMSQSIPRSKAQIIYFVFDVGEHSMVCIRMSVIIRRTVSFRLDSIENLTAS